ncbi:TonB family protein [Maribacter sp. X9]|uniref:TonB family protein n=1 Tax=Maribacter sp. X9 TaxID=3402159 RepID=UPI003AF37AE1
MLQYILECIAFQLLFLVIYDFFLKRETFFQWNRAYLLGTYALSLLLPWIKIEAFKNRLPQQLKGYPEFWWNLNKPETVVEVTNASGLDWTWQEMLLYGGMILATLILGYKLWQLYQLKRNGEVIRYADFTQIVIANSALAFSFFKSIFIGDKVLEQKHDTIIAHELVHIKQRHTWDLLFFELMRILGWFNPLVYVYQSRTAELHEFIADAQVAKERKSEHYQQLLSQVFQTEHISFINQFFTKSLIKKRIVMLQKSKSKKVWQLKYLLLVPMVLGMLFYTSCDLESKTEDELLNKSSLKTTTEIAFAKVDEVPVFPGCEDVEDKRICFNNMMQQHISKHFSYPKEAQTAGIEGRVNVMFRINEQGHVDDLKMRGSNILLENEVERIINRLPKMQPALHKGNVVAIPYSIPVVFKLESNDYPSEESKAINLAEDVPFGLVAEVPVFPGCESAADKRACFNDKIQLHISKNFSYPMEAQKAGIQGRVSVMFKIDSNGLVQNIESKGTNKLLTDEVERIIQRLPQMSSGKSEGKNVNVVYSIPVDFKLN